ncbi:hypothetical protein M5689_006835 [Euphorbia peplus]|nr:hypothetical protein M5689_006835 [Euphorbia peplus]
MEQEVLTSDDHVHFLWLLLCNYIFEPLGGRPTAEILVIAKTLAHGISLALGMMLLAQTFHRLSLTVGKNAFAKPKGGLWLFQLWIFAYFRHLATKMSVESLGNLSIDLCSTSLELLVSSVVRFFRFLVPSSMNELFRFRRVNETYLPPSAISYISALTLKKTKWWHVYYTT